MSRQLFKAVAWALFALVCALVLVAFVLSAFNQYPLSDMVGAGLGVPGYGLVGALIASRQSKNWIGWLLLAFGTLVALGIFSDQYGIYGLVTYPGALPAAEWVAGPSFWIWPPAVGALLLFVPLLFPNGKLPSPRWRWVAWADAILLLIGGSLLAVNPDPSELYPEVRNPIAIAAPPFMNTLVLPIISVVLIGCVAASFAAFVFRFRHAAPVERQQLKWVLYALTLIVSSFILNIVLLDLLSLTALNGILSILLDIAFLAVPAAIGIAVLRYRLFDIDVIIRRTVTYAAVAALLAIIYFGSVILLQQIFSNLTGFGQNEIVTVLSTLTIAALFVPLRNKIQAWIDRRFNRKKYDAQQVLNDFAKTVRDETDLEKLSVRLMQVVDETMQPTNISMWLKKSVQGKGESDV